MVKLKPDIIARIRMYTKAEGGKSKTISGEQFGCPLYYKNEGFECRLLLAGKVYLRAGDIAELPIKFLFPEHIKPCLKAGDTFTLWDLGTFAIGEVLHVSEEAVV
jgi:hypothetical protein